MFRFSIIILFIFAFGISLNAQDGNKLAHVRYIFEQKELMPDDSIRVVAEITPKKGWHLYWANPGDAGLATIVEFNLPEGFSAGNMIWENPEIIESEGLFTFGYSKKFHLIFTVYPPPKFVLNELKMVFKTGWLACKEKCVSGETSDTFMLKDLSKYQAKYSKSKLSDLMKKTPHLSESGQFAVIQSHNELKLIWSSKWDLGSKVKLLPYEEGIFKYKSEYIVENDGRNNIVSLELDKLRAGDPERLRLLLLPSIKKNTKSIEINQLISK